MKKILLSLMIASFVFGCAHHKPYLKPLPREEEKRIEATVYFDFNQWTLKPDQERVIREKAQLIRGNPLVSVIVEGHTDLVGSDEYNLRLGDRRARKVKLELVNAGVSEDRVVVLSYGKKKPLMQGKSQTAGSANRRVVIQAK